MSEAITRVIQQPLSQCPVNRADQLLEALRFGVSDLPPARQLVTLPLFLDQRLDVGMLAEESFGLLSPRMREFRECLLNLARFDDRGLGHSSGLAPERPPVDRLRFLTDAPGLGQPFFELLL